MTLGERRVNSASVDSAKRTGLVDFGNPGRLHHWRLLLTDCEGLGPLPVDIHTGEFFAVMIVDSDLPMAVFSPPVCFTHF